MLALASSGVCSPLVFIDKIPWPVNKEEENTEGAVTSLPVLDVMTVLVLHRATFQQLLFLKSNKLKFAPLIPCRSN